MMHYHHLKTLLLILLLANVAIADTVTTTDGSILNGTITLIDKGVIHIETPYAGKLELKQADVASFKTDSTLVVRLENGIIVPGTVTPGEGNALSIKAGENTIQTKTTEIKASWTPDKIDPETERNTRKWKNDFAADINGRTGNVDRFNLGMELDFRLKGPRDELYFGFEYEQGEENGNKTEDRALGQVSYEQFGEKKIGWFIRSSLETDPINDVYLRSVSSAGASYRLINNENQTLVIRNGLGYRFTDFEISGNENESTAIFKTALIHTFQFKDWFYLENNLDYSPSLADINNYNLAHESSIRIPVGNGESFWIRFGMRNEYETQTNAAEPLDTNYYSQLIYSWK